MTLDQDAVTISTAEQERPADPRPAWERIAYAWLAHEVDAGQPVDPATLAGEVSVTAGFAGDLVRVLRTHRDRDPELLELRGRLVRDRITDAYLARELPGGRPLDPAELAAEVGTTTTVARQWLHSLRAGRQTDPRLGSLRAEPVSHGHPSPEQLQALQAAYAGGGRPQLQDPRPAERALERIEQLYQAREIGRGQPLDPAAVAHEVGVSEHYVRGTLAALRGGTLTSAQRITQLWRLWEADGGQRLAFAEVARLVGVREGRVRQVLGPLRTAHRHAIQAERPGQPVTVVEDSGRQAWLDQAACRDRDPEQFFPEPGEQAKAAEAKAICTSCQVRDHCLDLAVKAAGGLDADHGVFGGTLPAERSRHRGNSFPEPSVLRERRELAAAAHALAGEVGLRQAARQLGIHRDALKAAFTQWELPMPERRVGCSPAASSPTAPKPNGPSSSRRSSAASTPPPLNSVPPGRRCAKPSPATAWACRPATPKPSASAPSTPPASAAASRPPRTWTRCSWPSTLAPSRLESGQRPSCTSGSAARSSTPPWAPTWSSSCTAKATPASPPLGRGRSSDGPTAATGWSANAPAAPSAATPTEPTEPTEPTNPKSGRWRPMLADPTRPDQPDGEPRFAPVV
jgi:WhiB family transcriptional regulator, redox-sensing transcriptional regulator